LFAPFQAPSPSAGLIATGCYLAFSKLRIPERLVRRLPFGDDPGMGFNRRKMGDRRQQAAEKEAAARRATDAMVLEDAEGLIGAWNERQAKRMPMIFSPTIGAAIKAGYWFLWARCPACRVTGDVDLR
jgi:hypothetical protein